MTPRFGTLQAQTAASQLGERDRRLLVLIEQFRYATSRQLAQLTAQHYGSLRSAQRQTNRGLEHLEADGLITPLARNIGGRHSGSGSTVWTYSPEGAHVADALHGRAYGRRTRAWHRTPSDRFLAHTLAVTDLSVRLHVLEAEGRLAAVTTQSEPACWRRHLDTSGSPLWLKPDLAVTTVTTDSYIDQWFIELDLDTENPDRIVKKSLQYQDYRHSGKEQEQHGVFPAVIWIAPNEKRQHQLHTRLAGDARINQRLFTVITPEQFGDLVTTGVDHFTKHTSGQEGGTPS